MWWIALFILGYMLYRTALLRHHLPQPAVRTLLLTQVTKGYPLSSLDTRSRL